jgi:hypothetical protein
MSSKAATQLVVSGLILLTLFFLGTLLLHSATTTPTAEVSLAIISGAALVIERSLEVSWSFIDMTTGSWWPLSDIGKQVNQRVSNFGSFAKPYFDGLKKGVDGLPGLNEAERDGIKEQIEAAFNTIPTVDEVSHLTSDARLNQLASTAAGRVNAILAEHPGLRQHIGNDIDLGAKLVNEAQAFMTSFSDNPGRRIISLYVAAMIGMVVAAIAGLDVFGATNHHLGDVGVPLTGLVMGLGSNPTHEIIAALQQYKQKSAT